MDYSALLETVTTRRTIRLFKTEPVSMDEFNV